ncbi:alpha/beta hydrolase [Actinophytocola oryzae]|uniref:Alpha/beta hydrolase family protein n=1 Tax=Actinophytocola oryzae TaxID=502181 RepID=A0A4R7W073_9PSEU|nr:alpha/beta hydrolase [Actinophytocola oryzae]TDV55338.1 alpha/beta hydrolase family protein [Actinophytocola oryzae]
MTAWRVRVATLVAAVGVLSACTAGPSSRPEIITNDGPGASTTPSVARSEVPQLENADTSIQWRTCSPEIQSALSVQPLPAWLDARCGKFNGVLDSPYAPDRGTARIQLLKAGDGPVPIVVVNDVDGLPGSVYAARLAASLPQEFFEKFQLIGMDRRGTGNSAAARCVPPETRRTMVEFDPSALDVDDWFHAAQTAGQQCSIALESQLPAFDTWRTAADLDVLRTALGVSRLNGVGHGEGSRVLSMYADRFPDRVGRLVLDGVPDPSADAQLTYEGIAKGGEAAWDAFAADCVQRGCPLGNDPERSLLELLGQLRTAPIDGPTLTVTAGAAMHAILIGLSDRDSWRNLAAALAAAKTGNGDGLRAILAPYVLDSDDQAASFDGTLVTTCNDMSTRMSPEQVTTSAKEWQQKYPLFGPIAAERLAFCAPWTIPDHPLPTPTGRGAPPILVLGTASDAITPIEGTERAAQQLDSGVLVSWQGGGHGAIGVSPCATDVATKFLTDAAVPRNGTVCPP